MFVCVRKRERKRESGEGERVGRMLVKVERV